jgi:hypothetical protein
VGIRKAVTSAITLVVFALPLSAQRKPNMNVPRQSSETPEVVSSSPRKVQSGTTAPVSIEVKGVSGTRVSINSPEVCALRSSRVLGPGKFEANIEFKNVERTSYCDIRIGEGRTAAVTVEVAEDPQLAAVRMEREKKEAAESQAKAEKDAKEFQAKMASTDAALKEFVGKQWTIKPASGAAETWTVGAVKFMQVRLTGPNGKTGSYMQNEQQSMFFVGNDCVFQVKSKTADSMTAESMPYTCQKGPYSGKITISIQR